jgi:hypothetical protein
LSAAFRIGTEAPKLLSAAFRIDTEAPKLLSAAFRIGTEEPKLLSGPLRLLWIGRTNRFGLPAFGGKANFAVANGNTRRLRRRKTIIRIAPSLFLPTQSVIEAIFA